MEPVEGLGLTILILALKHTYQLCGIGQFRTLAHNHISPRQWQPYEQLFRRPFGGSSEWHSSRMNWRTSVSNSFNNRRRLHFLKRQLHRTQTVGWEPQNSLDSHCSLKG